jgi:hypothetical protein
LIVLSCDFKGSIKDSFNIYIDEKYYQPGFSLDSIEIKNEEITVDGVPTNITYFISEGQVVEEYVKITKNNLSYYLVLHSSSSKDHELFKKVLSTFKFLQFNISYQSYDECNKISREYYRAFCYINVNLINKESPPCDSLINEYPRRICYNGFAINTLDYSLCDKMEIKDWTYSYCYSEIAKAKNDLSICDNIINEPDYDRKGKCYADFAGDTNNPSICEKITSEMWKEQCYYNLNLV